MIFLKQMLLAGIIKNYKHMIVHDKYMYTYAAHYCVINDKQQKGPKPFKIWVNMQDKRATDSIQNGVLPISCIWSWTFYRSANWCPNDIWPVSKVYLILHCWGTHSALTYVTLHSLTLYWRWRSFHSQSPQPGSSPRSPRRISRPPATAGCPPKSDNSHRYSQF